ncbi:MAG: D-sedoheptulose 7-phosphate isomerase, partial [Pseudomonadota bacterium]
IYYRVGLITVKDYMAQISRISKEIESVNKDFFSHPENMATIQAIVDQMVQTLKSGGKIIACGNGGSMSDAMHFAEELTGRFKKDRISLPATAISDPSLLTCVANDFGFEKIFSRYVEAHGKPGDILLAISTSGKSPNVIQAIHAAHEQKMKSVGLLGKDGGEMKGIAQFSLIAPSFSTERIQELHIQIIHILVEGIERAIFPQNY